MLEEEISHLIVHPEYQALVSNEQVGSKALPSCVSKSDSNEESFYYIGDSDEEEEQ